MLIDNETGEHKRFVYFKGQVREFQMFETPMFDEHPEGALQCEIPLPLFVETPEELKRFMMSPFFDTEQECVNSICGAEHHYIC